MKIVLNVTLEQAMRVRDMVAQVADATAFYDLADGRELEKVANQITKQVNKNGKRQTSSQTIEEVPAKVEARQP